MSGDFAENDPARIEAYRRKGSDQRPTSVLLAADYPNPKFRISQQYQESLVDKFQHKCEWANEDFSSQSFFPGNTTPSLHAAGVRRRRDQDHANALGCRRSRKALSE